MGIRAWLGFAAAVSLLVVRRVPSLAPVVLLSAVFQVVYPFYIVESLPLWLRQPDLGPGSSAIESFTPFAVKWIVPLVLPAIVLQLVHALTRINERGESSRRAQESGPAGASSADQTRRNNQQIQASAGYVKSFLLSEGIYAIAFWFFLSRKNQKALGLASRGLERHRKMERLMDAAVVHTREYAGRTRKRRAALEGRLNALKLAMDELAMDTYAAGAAGVDRDQRRLQRLCRSHTRLLALGSTASAHRAEQVDAVEILSLSQLAVAAKTELLHEILIISKIMPSQEHRA